MLTGHSKQKPKMKNFQKSLLLILLGAVAALGVEWLWKNYLMPVPENAFRESDVPAFITRDFQKTDTEKISDQVAEQYTTDYKLMMLKPIHPNWQYKPLQTALWEDYCPTCPNTKILNLNIRRTAIEDMMKQTDASGKRAEFLLIYPGLKGNSRNILTFVLAPGDAQGRRISARTVPAGDNSPVAYDELGTCPHPCRGFQ